MNARGRLITFAWRGVITVSELPEFIIIRRAKVTVKKRRGAKYFASFEQPRGEYVHRATTGRERIVRG